MLVVACVLLASCIEGNRELSESELSTFGEYVNALDTSQMEKHLTHILRSDTSHWAADKAVRQLYAGKHIGNDEPLWFSRMGVSSRADSLVSWLRRELPRNGLDTAAFFIPEIAADLQVVHGLAFDSLGIDINELLPRLDYHLSKAYVRYTAGMRQGFVRPDRLLNNLEMKANTTNYARLFDYEVKAPDYQEPLRKLESEDRMAYLAASVPDGNVYRALLAKMEKAASAGERSKIAVNLERCRWQTNWPPANSERMVLVNIPALHLWAVDADSVLDMRICCGATTNKTPLLHSMISHFQVNPDWIVPQNIVESDFMRHAGDSAYFARHRYYIVDRSAGDTLNPAEVTAEELKAGRLRVGQKGGAGNSLGRIVFRFANDFGIYLHDTNNHGAFNNERRTLSHGCIRVQKPFELACFFLPEASEWELEQLRISMDMKPETERGLLYLKEHADDPRPFRLMAYHDISPRVPLYIVYFTAYPNPSTGVVETWPDLYGYDKAVSREMAPFLIKN